MKFKTFSLRTNLLSKLLLSLALLIGSANVWADETLTINGDAPLTTTSHFPIYGSVTNKSPLCSQYIISKSQLNDLKNSTIKKIILYATVSNKNWGDARFKVYLKEVDETNFPSSPISVVEDGLTEVYSGEITINSDSQMEIPLSGEGYVYNGNNLLVSFNLTTTGSTYSSNFYAKSNSAAGSFYNIIYQYSNWKDETAYSGEKYLPKMTFVYSAASNPAPTSFTCSSLAYNTATLSWTNGSTETQWQIVCSTTDSSDADTPTLINTKPYTIEGLNQSTTYYVYLRAYYEAGLQSEWVRTSFTTYEQYPTPTDFVKTGVTASTATFSWKNGAGTEATKWIIKYSTTQGFDPDETGYTEVVAKNPYTIEGLTENTTYFARICADYGSSHYSSWNSTEIEFTPSNFVNILVNDGTDKSYNIPIAGSSVSADENSMVKGQFVIPASSLTGMCNRQITQLTFYAENSSVSWGTAAFEVYLNEVSYTTFNSTSFGSWGTNVYNSASLSISTNEMSIILDTPFNYTGGNLQVGFKQTAKGSSNSTTWLSVKDGGYANLAIYGTGTGSTGLRTYYAPKVTITSVPITTAPVKIDANGYTTFASPWPLDLTAMPDGLTAYRAELDIPNSKVRLIDDVNQTVQENTGVLLAGTAGETYEIPVAVSGTALAGNDFLVNVEGGTFTPGAYTYYALKKNSDPLVFGTFNPSTVAIPSNKAYVKVPTTSVKEFTCEFGDATAVQNIKEGQAAVKGAVFDLSGRRVAQPMKGLYIIDGKKVVIK